MAGQAHQLQRSLRRTKRLYEPLCLRVFPALVGGHLVHDSCKQWNRGEEICVIWAAGKTQDVTGGARFFFQLVYIFGLFPLLFPQFTVNDEKVSILFFNQFNFLTSSIPMNRLGPSLQRRRPWI